MKRLVLFLVLVAASLFGLIGSGPAKPAEKGTHAAPTSASRGKSGEAAQPPKPNEEAKALEVRQQQLLEKEAALKAKEQELNAMAAKLDARIQELNNAQKAIEKSLMAKKKESNERYRRILKVYRALKAEEAAKLINKLEDTMAIEMLDQMDQKTAVKLIPYLNQPNVLRWTRENLKGK